MSDDEGTSHLAEEQMERERRKLFGRGDGGDVIQKHASDKRVTRFLDWLLPFLALGVFGYFASKIDKLSDAIIATNSQIAVMIEQNKMMQEGFKDHENRIRDLEGRKFRGVPGYGEPSKESPRVR